MWSVPDWFVRFPTEWRLYIGAQTKYTLRLRSRPTSLVSAFYLARDAPSTLSNSSAATRGGDEHSAASLSMAARSSAGVERAAPPSSPVGGSPTLWSSKRLTGLRSGQVALSPHTQGGGARPSTPRLNDPTAFKVEGPVHMGGRACCAMHTG